MKPRRHASGGAGRAATRALFIDLAGVLLDNAHAPGQLAGLRSCSGAALRLLDRLDYRMVVLAPCVQDRRQGAHVPPARIHDLLFRERIVVAGICRCRAIGASGAARHDACTDARTYSRTYSCPDACADCPPAPGMLLRAARDYGIAMGASWLLAGSTRHVAAGRQAGCRTILVGAAGAGLPQPAQSPDATGPAGLDAHGARDMMDAALAIVRMDGGQEMGAPWPDGAA